MFYTLNKNILYGPIVIDAMNDLSTRTCFVDILFAILLKICDCLIEPMLFVRFIVFCCIECAHFISMLHLEIMSYV